MSTLTPPVPFHDTEREFYGEKVAAVEPGGVEFIPLDERHGSPSSCCGRGRRRTWSSRRSRVGMLGDAVLGADLLADACWRSSSAPLAGAHLAAVLSTWGPKDGLCQMVLSRTGFGFLGNILPSGLNAMIAGIGWFAVNSISGALALHVLISGLPKQLCLVIIVRARTGNRLLRSQPGARLRAVRVPGAHGDLRGRRRSGC